MGRAVRRVHMVHFWGLGLAGEALSSPLQGTSGQTFGVFFADSDNVWAPDGVLTNDGVGYALQDAGAEVLLPWRWIGFLSLSNGTRQLVGVAGTKLWVQAGLAGVWVEVMAGLPADTHWTGIQYRDQMFIVSATGSMIVYSPLVGAGVGRTWMTTPPTNTLVATPSGAGTLSAASGWRYLVTYIRDDGFESPSNTTPTNSGAFSSKAQVDLTVIPVSAQAGVTHKKLWRTTDGGSTYRYLATITNATTTYIDTTTDGALSTVECDMIDAYSDWYGKVVGRSGDAIYVGDCVDSAASYPERVRFSYPGKPWRFDVLDYTDEADGRVVALYGEQHGLLAWTPTNVVALRPLGGGAIAIQRLPWPGAVRPQLVAGARGTVGWIAPDGMYLAGEAIADPSDDLENYYRGRVPSSIGGLVRGLGATGLAEAWALYSPAYNAMLFALGASASGPDRIYVYDIGRKAWWKLGYGARCGCIAAYSDGGPIDTVILGRHDAKTMRALYGRTADGAALVPTITIGPTDLGIEQEKRFRHAELHMTVSNALDLLVRYEIDRGIRTGTEQALLLVDADLLGSTFVLGISELGGSYSDQRRVAIRDTGTEIELMVKEQQGTGGLLQVRAIDLLLQLDAEEKVE